MTSSYWDESQASAYREFRFDFPEKSLAHKTIIVAGGTGGLGAATVSLLTREGASVIVGFRSNRERARQLSIAMDQQSGCKVTLVEGDLAEASVRRNYMDAVERLGNGLAGAAIFSGDPARIPFEKLDRDTLVASLDVNYIGPVLLAKDLGGVMESGKRDGSIVLLASMQAVATFPGSLNYAAPKAALLHAARILALQWNHVRVNVVAPGATIAGMASTSVQSGKYDRHVASGAVTRFGCAEDVARAVRFFLEPDNYVTGQTLVVDGGLTLRRDRG